MEFELIQVYSPYNSRPALFDVTTCTNTNYLCNVHPPTWPHFSSHFNVQEAPSVGIN